MKRNNAQNHRAYRRLRPWGLVLILALLMTVMTGCFGTTIQPERPKITFPTPSAPSVATQPTDGAKLHPNLPEELQDNVYLQNRGMGDCQSMTGQVLLTVIFASDGESTWSESRMQELTASIGQVEARMEQDAAAWGAQLDLTVEFMTGTATSGQLVMGDNKEWVDSVMKSAGLGSRMEVNQTLEQNRGVKEAPVAIFVDREGRSFANSGTGDAAPEYVICYEDADALYHELNHVFGAKDFYLPQSVKELAETYLPGSIMVDSGEGVMDALTAYLIGWTDDLSTEAMAFLRSTADLTKEQLDEEKERDQYTGYVTDFQKGDAIYTGYLIDGVLHGYGTRTKLNGDSYTGDWNYGACHGTGTYTWASGDSYTGQWADGSRHGTGTYTWADGDSYTGDWVEGARTGYGIWTSSDGNTYEGEFLNGKFHGQGTFTFAIGDSYTGDWVEGMHHGYGIYTWANGTKYEGQFANDKRHGQGTLTYYSGTVQSGLWENGEFIG